MRVHVTTWMHPHFDRQHLTIDIEPTDPVEELKAEIHRRTHYSPCSQRLEFNGQSLDNGWLIRHYNIEEGSEINALIRLAGKGYVDSEYRLLAYTYNVYKSVCRKCDARLPPDATHCRKKKCHSNDIRPKNTTYYNRILKNQFWTYRTSDIRLLEKYKP